jgi:hypothetical protein
MVAPDAYLKFRRSNKETYCEVMLCEYVCTCTGPDVNGIRIRKENWSKKTNARHSPGANVEEKNNVEPP